MRSRTNPVGAYQKDKPTYRGVTCNFSDFQCFAEWSSTQIGARNKDWHLDKDLLGSGKEYSGGVCVFLPSEINSFLVSPIAKRGAYPQGVSWKIKNNKFVANGRDSVGNYKHLGLFNSVDAASGAYIVFKSSVAKELANKWKDQIDPRAYNALMNYQVEITD